MIKWIKKKFRQRCMSEEEKIYDNMNEYIIYIEAKIRKRKEKGFMNYTTGGVNENRDICFITSVSYDDNYYYSIAKDNFMSYFRSKGYKVSHRISNDYENGVYAFRVDISWEEL